MPPICDRSAQCIIATSEDAVLGNCLPDNIVRSGLREWVMTASAISHRVDVKHFTCIFIPKAYD